MSVGIRAIGYVRVSTAGQVDNHSLAAQERAIRDACTAREYILVDILREEGVSAHSEKIETRPQFSALMERVKKHEVDVVMVYSLDRWSRSLLVTATTFSMLAQNNVGFVSLSEAADYSTAEGKLHLQIVGAFAEFYSASLSRHTSKGKKERALSGLTNVSRTPMGYTIADGKLVVDPKTAVVLHEMFVRYSNGESTTDLAEWLSHIGYIRTCSGVRHTLLNRLYLGEVQYHDEWLPGSHQPLVDPTLFYSVAARMSVNRRQRAATHHGKVRVLSGLLTCGLCGQPFYAVGQDRQGYLRYKCSQHVSNRKCLAPSFREATILDQISGILAKLNLSPELVAQAAKQEPVEESDVKPELIQAQIDRLTDSYVLGVVPRDEYITRINDLVQKRDQIKEKVMHIDPQAVAAQLRDLVGLWAKVDEKDRRTIATSFFSDPIVVNQTIVSLRPFPGAEPIYSLSFQTDPARPGYLLV